MNALTRRQNIGVVIVGFLAALFTQVPYWLAARWFVPEGMVSTGLIGAIWDQNSYLMWVQQAQAGGWGAYNLYAIEPQHARFFHPLFWMMGKISAWTSWDIVTVYHGGRVVLNTLLFLLIVRIAVHLFDRLSLAIPAACLAIFGGGIGWLLPGALIEYWAAKFQLISADVSIVDAYVYVSAFRKPLFVASMGLMLFIVWSWWRWEEERQPSRIWKASLACLVLAAIHPYDLVTLSVIAGTRGLLRWRRSSTFQLTHWIPALGIGVTGVFPGWIYHQWVFGADQPAFHLWAQANEVPYPSNPYGLILSFGVILIWVVWGWKEFWRNPKTEWLLAWMLAVAFLVFAPLRHQGKFTLGWMIPIGLLAGYGWTRMAARGSAWKSAALVLAALSTGSTWWTMARDTGFNKQLPLNVHLYREDQEALNWLKTHASVQEAVLSSLQIGSYLPRYANCIAFVGHYSMSPYFEQKRTEVKKFFESTTSDQWRRDLLKTRSLQYVYWGPFERLVGSYNPTFLVGLVKIYENGKVCIFKVPPQTQLLGNE